MRSTAWVALFRHIPNEQQNRLTLVTASGLEITVQSFLRIDQEFVAIKGRLSGTQDVGRVFFIPYANIDYLGFQHEVKDDEFNSLFGELIIPDLDLPQPSATSNGQVPVPVPEVPAPSSQSGSDIRPAIRSEVLERYRSRPGQP